MKTVHSILFGLCLMAAMFFVEEPMLFIIFMILAFFELTFCEDFKKRTNGVTPPTHLTSAQGS